MKCSIEPCSRIFWNKAYYSFTFIWCLSRSPNLMLTYVYASKVGQWNVVTLAVQCSTMHRVDTEAVVLVSVIHKTLSNQKWRNLLLLNFLEIRQSNWKFTLAEEIDKTVIINDDIDQLCLHTVIVGHLITTFFSIKSIIHLTSDLHCQLFMVWYVTVVKYNKVK